MADKKITGLNVLLIATAVDVIPIVNVDRDGTTKKITLANLMGSPGPIGANTPNSGEFTTLELPAGTSVNEFSIDGTLAGDSDDAVPTEKAVATAINTKSDNIMINQDFTCWQKNTTFTNPANGIYTADGYYVESDAGGGILPTVNIKKNASVHEDAYEQSCELEITNVGTTGATRYWIKKQAVEDYKKYRGKTVTFSVRYKASIAITLPGKVLVFDGIGSQELDIDSIGTDWTTTEVTLTVNTGADRLQVYFYLIKGVLGTISTTGSIYIQWMKLEPGSVASPLIPKSTGEALDPTQRYYQKTYAQGVFLGTATEVGAVWQEITAVADEDHTMTINVKFPKVMKAAPNVVLYDLAGNAGKVTMAAGDNITGTVSQISDSGFKISATNGATATSRKIAFHYTAISRI